MNIITILIWITIAIIAAIAIIVVKLHYKGDQLETEEGSILPDTESINNAINIGKEKLNSQTNNTPSRNAPRSLSPNIQKVMIILFRKLKTTTQIMNTNHKIKF